MKRKWLSLVLLLLVACQPVTPAPLIKSTATLPLERTPTALSTVTPTARPFFDTTIPYELRQPKVDELLQMLDSILLIEEKNISDGPSPSLIALDPLSIHRLIGGDFIRYYSDGFSGAEDLLTQPTVPWKMRSFSDLYSFHAVLRIALLQYINSHQSLLENKEFFPLANFNITTYSLDFDGDRKQEWLVGAEYKEYNLISWLLIKKQDDSRYHFLSSDPSYDLAGIGDRSIDIEISDLTGDGNPEIIHALHYYLAGGMRRIITVYTWNNEGLYGFDSIHLPGIPPRYGELYESEYVIGDFNNDGVDEIRADTPRFGRFDCQWMEYSYYRFNDQEIEFETTSDDIPQTKECLITRALVSDVPSEQIRLYQKALENANTNGTTTDKLAWVRLHLAMAYAADGDDPKADSELEVLNSVKGDGKFLQFVKNIYETSHASPLAYCDALYAATYQRSLNRLGSDIDSELTHDLYPIDYAPVPNMVCPFPKTVKARLNGIKIPVTESPVDILTKLGLPFAWSKSINWDGDPLQEWVGVLQFSKPMIVLLDGGTFWEPVAIENYSMDATNFDTVVYSPSENTKTKLLVLFTTNSEYCGSPDVEKDLIIINPETFEYETQVKCDSVGYSLKSDEDIEFAITEFSNANRFDSKDMPRWYYLTDPEDVEGDQYDILDYVRSVEELVLSREDPMKADDKLSTIESALPIDDPAAHLLLSQLYYLRGLNYELNGQSDMAVETYLGLIEFSPESLWCQYAKMRLQPIQP